MTNTPSLFAQGSQALEQAAAMPAFASTNYFSLEDGESAILRFLTDFEPQPSAPHLGAWITVLQHQGVRTRPKPDWAAEDRKWPERWGCVCRHTKLGDGSTMLFQAMEDSDQGGCWVCANVKSEKHPTKPHHAGGRGWAYACLRKEIVHEGRRGYTDETREVERDGKTVTELALVVVNLGWQNFWSVLEGPGRHHGTVVDRDYLVTRKGTKTDTKYQIVNLDPLPGWDLRDPEVYQHYAAHIHESLDEVIMGQAKVDYQRRWFDPTFTPPKKDGDGQAQGGAPAEQVQQAPTNQPSPDALAAMAARVTSGYGQPAPAPEQQQPAAAAPDQPQQGGQQPPAGFQPIG